MISRAVVTPFGNDKHGPSSSGAPSTLSKVLTRLVNPDPLDQRRGGAESATQGASFQAGLRGQGYGEFNSSGRVALDEETIKDANFSRFAQKRL